MSFLFNKSLLFFTNSFSRNEKGEFFSPSSFLCSPFCSLVFTFYCKFVQFFTVAFSMPFFLAFPQNSKKNDKLAAPPDHYLVFFFPASFSLISYLLFNVLTYYRRNGGGDKAIKSSSLYNVRHLVLFLCFFFLILLPFLVTIFSWFFGHHRRLVHHFCPITEFLLPQTHFFLAFLLSFFMRAIFLWLRKISGFV